MPAPMIVDVDVEDLLITRLAADLLAQGFTGVKVAGSKPAGAESVVVYRTGGARRDFLTDRATVGFDVRAARASRAVTILNMVLALVRNLEGQALSGHAVDEVQTMRGVTSDPLPPEDPVRYSALLTITVRS